MPISVVCTGCQKKLKAPDSAAGKRTKCPACQSVIEIPATAVSSGKDSWTVKIASGDDFGPVTKAELDQWLKEGRLDDQCQVLQDGAPQWQWASDLYPELAAAANQPGQGAAVDPFGQPAVDPFGQAAGMQPQPMGMQPGGYPAAPSVSGQAFPAQTPAFQTNPAAGNPYAGSSATTRAQASSGDPSGQIITVAVLSFVLGAFNLMCGIGLTLTAFGGAILMGSLDRRGLDGASVVGGIWFVLFIVFALFFLVFAIMLLASGVGLLKRESWGRILALVCAGLAGAFALLDIYGISNGAYWQFGLGFLMNVGYCITTFILLLNGNVSRAFAKKR